MILARTAAAVFHCERTSCFRSPLLVRLSPTQDAAIGPLATFSSQVAPATPPRSERRGAPLTLFSEGRPTSCFSTGLLQGLRPPLPEKP